MSEIKYDVFAPKTRADWFITTTGMIRKNFTGWTKDGDFPLPGVRVCVFGIYNEKYDRLAEVAEPNWDAYCRRHGYAFRLYPGGYHEDPTKPETFGDKSKFSYFYDMWALFDIIAFVDIDSLFVDMDRTIEAELGFAYLNLHKQSSGGWADVAEASLRARFIWTYGPGGPMSGLMIARTDDLTERHLRYAYEYAAVNNNVRHGKIEPNGISDQDAMKALMHVPPFSQTLGNCVEAESIGFCFPDTKNPRPWIVSAKGGDLENKIAALTPWLTRTTQPA